MHDTAGQAAILRDHFYLICIPELQDTFSLTCWLLLAGVCGAWLLASMELVAATASVRPRWSPLSWQWRWRKREKAAYMSCAGAGAGYKQHHV